MVTAAVGQYPGVVGYRAAQAAIFAAGGDREQARAVLSPLAVSGFAEIQCDALFLWTLGVLTEAAVACGEAEWLRTLRERMGPYHAQNVVMSWGVAFDGSVAHFLGQLCAGLGEFDEAVSHFEAAVAMNTKMQAVPLVARTQERYAACLLERRQPGDVELARELLERARETMDRLGQVGHLARVEQQLSALDAEHQGAPAGVAGERVEDAFTGVPMLPYSRRAEGETPYLFRREAHFWTVVFEGSVVRLRHTRGLALLFQLLQRPEKQVHVFDLMSAVNGLPVLSEMGNEGGSSRPYTWRRDDAGPLIDAQARAEYRRRLQDLRGELAEAERFNDLGRVSMLRTEAAQLAGELQRAYGKTGVPRRAASATERARISVRNNIAHTLNTLKRSDEGLWRHMKTAVRTGTFCCYQPERTIPWAF